MKNMLENDLPMHYAVGRRIACVEEQTTAKDFDLIDAPFRFIVNHGMGGASFVGNMHLLSVINYDKFIEKFTPTVVEKGKRRCDFIMTDVGTNTLCLLCELTSCTNSIENLSKPIHDKHGNVMFPCGKYEKAEIQLFQTLDNIIAVPVIDAYITAKARKICLMSYVINNTSSEHAAIDAFNRARKMEAQEAGENGANIPFPAVEAYGFLYYRISHVYSFKL